MKPSEIPICRLGNCVIERDSKRFLIMLPDGTVKGCRNYAAAVKHSNRYFAAHTPDDALGVGCLVSYDGSIEIRTVRNGYVKGE